MSDGKAEAHTDDNEVVKEKPEFVTIRFPNLKGAMQVPLEIILNVVFLQTALYSGMRESERKLIEIRFDTTKEVARAYFSLKWYLLKSMNTGKEDPTDSWSPDVYDGIVELSDFFDDNECLTILVEKYLEECFPNDSTIPFWHKMKDFISRKPFFAQWIWESIDKDTLLKYMSVPRKRKNTLLKKDFCDLQPYIEACGNFVIQEEDLVLKELYAKLEFSETSLLLSDDAINVIYAKINAHKLAKERARRRNKANDGDDRDLTTRAKILARMAQSASKDYNIFNIYRG